MATATPEFPFEINKVSIYLSIGHSEVLKTKIYENWKL